MPAIEGVPTSTAALVGRAQRGPTKPTLVTSFNDYERWYGGFIRSGPTGPAYLPYAVRGFFENGGRRLFIARVVQARPQSYERALKALSTIDEISVIAATEPGTGATLRPSQMVAEDCAARRDRIAILSTAADLAPIDVVKPEAHAYAALYYPWVCVPSGVGEISLAVPPVGHVAGIYARVDQTRGVHKAPANEPLQGLNFKQPLAAVLTDHDQERLNPMGVNCLRDFRTQNRGVVIWGARTLSNDPEYRYVSVRRLAIYIEQSITRGCQWAMLEPNGPPLWKQLVAATNNFLYTLFTQGALTGTKADEAYFVRCDQTTMTQDDIATGRLILQVGFAPLRPAEFVILRLSWQTQGGL